MIIWWEFKGLPEVIFRKLAWLNDYEFDHAVRSGKVGFLGEILGLDRGELVWLCRKRRSKSAAHDEEGRDE